MFKELLIASSLRCCSIKTLTSLQIELHTDIQIFRQRYSDIQARTNFVSRTFPSTAGILTTANLQTGNTAYLTQFGSIKPKKKILKILTLILKFDLAKFLPLD